MRTRAHANTHAYANTSSCEHTLICINIHKHKYVLGCDLAISAEKSTAVPPIIDVPALMSDFLLLSLCTSKRDILFLASGDSITLSLLRARRTNVEPDSAEGLRLPGEEYGESVKVSAGGKIGREKRKTRSK